MYIAIWHGLNIDPQNVTKQAGKESTFQPDFSFSFFVSIIIEPTDFQFPMQAVRLQIQTDFDKDEHSHRLVLVVSSTKV